MLVYSELLLKHRSTAPEMPLFYTCLEFTWKKPTTQTPKQPPNQTKNPKPPTHLQLSKRGEGVATANDDHNILPKKSYSPAVYAVK